MYSTFMRQYNLLHWFVSGDTVLCAIEMGVWWPGYELEISANRVSVAFWNENDM